MKPHLLFIAFAAMILSGCSGTEESGISLSVTEKTLHFGEEYQIQATSSSPITYTVENEYHASVSETGLVTALFVGETAIHLKSKDGSRIFILKVVPKSNLYPEPCTEWGISRDEIVGRYGKPAMEMEDGLSYEKYSDKAPMVVYLFDENSKLKSAAVMVETAYSEELGTFLAERYMSLTQSDGKFGFVNGLTPETVTTAIVASLYNISHWQVIYVPFSGKTQNASVEQQSEAVSKSFARLMGTE